MHHADGVGVRDVWSRAGVAAAPLPPTTGGPPVFEVYRDDCPGGYEDCDDDEGGGWIFAVDRASVSQLHD